MTEAAVVPTLQEWLEDYAPLIASRRLGRFLDEVHGRIDVRAEIVTDHKTDTFGALIRFGEPDGSRFVLGRAYYVYVLEERHTVVLRVGPGLRRTASLTEVVAYGRAWAAQVAAPAVVMPAPWPSIADSLAEDKVKA